MSMKVIGVLALTVFASFAGSVAYAGDKDCFCALPLNNKLTQDQVSVSIPDPDYVLFWANYVTSASLTFSGAGSDQSFEKQRLFLRKSFTDDGLTAFEKVKEKLDVEGYFADAEKRQGSIVAFFPSASGVQKSFRVKDQNSDGVMDTHSWQVGGEIRFTFQRRVKMDEKLLGEKTEKVAQFSVLVKKDPVSQTLKINHMAIHNIKELIK